jgi:hypothetical protein
MVLHANRENGLFPRENLSALFSRGFADLQIRFALKMRRNKDSIRRELAEHLQL